MFRGTQRHFRLNLGSLFLLFMKDTFYFSIQTNHVWCFLEAKMRDAEREAEVVTLVHTPLLLLLLTYFCCPSVSPSFKVAL